MNIRVEKRIETTFCNLKEKKKKALTIYLTAGYPNLDFTTKALQKLSQIGVDIIELGFPFSDPVADGEIIQKTSKIAINQGVTLTKVLKLVEDFRKINQTTPIILMGYYNPILAYGIEKFAKQASLSGVDGVIIVDLPIEEDEELYGHLKSKNIDIIRIIAPTTSKKRLNKIIRKSSSCLYYVSITGITGGQMTSESRLSKASKHIKSATRLPIMIGFGIKTTKDLKLATSYFDAGVIGSEALRIIDVSLQNNSDPIINLNQYCNKLIKSIA